MQNLLKAYLKKLTNLSSSNKSLLLLRLLKSQDIDLHDFDYLTNEPSFSILEKLVKQKKRIDLCAFVDTRLEENNTVSKQLKQISRKNRQIFEERGAQDLYIGWPFVEGKLLNDAPIRCPLLFFPIELFSENNVWYIQLRENVSITFNKSFLLAYSFFNETKIEDEIIETNFDDWTKNFQEFKNELYELIKKSPLEINFNQHLFEDTLLPYTRYGKQDYLNATQKGVLKLQNQATLGLFPQADSYLVPDYEWLIQHNSFPSLDDFFLSKKQENYINILKEEQTFTPFALDAFQEKAIHKVKEGFSISVQGPPGTGKSQLICNLATDFIARGKKVLIVCQKKAALDVVYQRLNSKNIGLFIGQINDFKTDRSKIFEQLNIQIDKSVEYKKINSTYDVIQLERNFTSVSRQIDGIIENLNEFKIALFDTKECGISIKELYLKSNRQAPYISLRREYNHFTFDRINTFIQKLKSYLPYVILYQQENYTWYNRKSFQHLGITDLEKIHDSLDDVLPTNHAFQSETQKIIGTSISLQNAEWLVDRKQDFLNLLSLLENPTVFKYFQHFLHINPNEEWLLLQEQNLLGSFKEQGMETNISNDNLGNIRQILENCIDAFQQIHKWVIWKLRNRKDTYTLQKLILNNGLSWDLKGLKKLAILIDNRQNFEHHLSELREQKWLIDVPKTTNLEEIKNWFYHQNMAISIFKEVHTLQNFREHFGFYKDNYETVKFKTEKTLALSDGFLTKKTNWERYLSPTQIQNIINRTNWKNELKKSLDTDFDKLCEYDKQTANLQLVEIDTINKILENCQELTIDNCMNFFLNSIYSAWIDHIEIKHPILRNVSSLSIFQQEELLQELVQEKQSLAEAILKIRLREHSYKNFEYNRLENLITYRELKRQTTKKRKIWTLRKLFDNFSDEIFNLVPCWLASPESVSAVFSMETNFDLVIFDEASQCFSEKSIPALFRGKQLMITGDEHQLQPNDLYQIRWEEAENEEENLDVEIDSLLTLANHYLPKTMLKEHYRSESLDLINFSNQHFYNNELRLLPNFKTLNEHKSHLNYLKVDGIWEDNKNITEAYKITELIHDLILEGIENIGIVTFNAKQQECIQDVLERSFDEKNISIPKQIFVKNIENVQGDERDVIIFSIGYAPSPSGKMSLHFGSLTTEKGENRLNVAITRAKKDIYVVSSIYPNQLNVETAKNRGPHLLKAYLEYVYEIHDKESNIPKLTIDLPKIALKKEFKDKYAPLLNNDLPFGDLVYYKENTYRGILLTDDDVFEKSISIKDNYAYLPLLLENKGWKYVRTYSRNFWHNREEQAQKIKGFFELLE